tara:strand:+ start:52 stop:252 length:201 start_codon:yes stop_codon:yes gene_type:complete
MAKFVVRIKDKLHTYSHYEHIPNHFDYLIEFNPDIPEGPHTELEHSEMTLWNNRLKELVKKERRGQ